MNLESLIGIEDIQNMVDLAKSTPPGCFIEVGVYKGGSSQYLYAAAQEQGRVLYLFDTFEGTPVKDDVDKHNIGDFSDVDLKLIRKELPLARIYIGVFPSSYPGTMIKNIAFVHVDCDQYQSVKDSISYIFPAVVEGGIMLFDDYNCLEGAKLAVDKYFSNELKFTKTGKAYIIK